jgi:flagellar M-ring protein FliF
MDQMAMRDEEAGTWWVRLSRTARLGLVTGVALIVASAIALAVWSSRSDYGVLFSQLNESDAASVVAQLKQQKIPYRLADGGTTIEVPAARVYDTRLALFSSDLPLSGGVGFEIYDHQGYGLTEEDQRVEYQRALQGELARTIDSIEGVKEARVHLVIPPHSIFRSDREPPSAAVALTLNPGVTLKRAQVAGMQRLVAASVAGLEPANVVINDQRGITLSAVSPNEPGSEGSDARLTVERDVEKYLADKITRLLDRAYGRGQALVSVDVSLNFDQASTTIQSLVPLPGTGREEGAILRRQQVSTGAGGGPSLATGPTGPSAARPIGSTTDVEYEYGRRVEQIVSTPGSITRMSIGIIVPGSLTEEKRQRITELVQMAAGASTRRGDQIDVEPLDALRSLSGNALPVGPGGVAPTSAAAAVPTPVRARSSATRSWTALEVGATACLILGGMAGLALGHRRGARAKPLSPRERQALLLEMERALTAEATPATRSGV